MSELSEHKLNISEVMRPSEHSTDPAYLAWKQAKIQAALDKKNDGTATYKSIDEVAAKFSFNAH